MDKQSFSKYKPIIIFFVLLAFSPILAFIAAGIYLYLHYKKKPQASAQPNKPRKNKSEAMPEYRFTTDATTMVSDPGGHQSNYSGLDPYLQEDLRKHKKRYKGMSDLLQ